MSLKNLTVRFAFVALCALVFAGCASKPKVDLSGVRANPNATAARNGKGGSGDGGFEGDSRFVEGPTDGDGFSSGGGNGGLNGGEWGSTSEPVKGTEDGNGFLKNAARWNDCAIYFAYDQSELPAGERAKADALVQYLNDNSGKGVIIEGHADERGSDEYNRALGERRALSVQQYLALSGIAENRIQTISYGEDRPAVANPQSESDHQLNRRAEFVLGDL